MNLLFLLALLASGNPPRNLTVEELGEGRYRLTITYPGGSSPEVHAHMVIRLMEHAERLCSGRGRAVSDGSLEANEAPRGRLALSETYSCR
jgi:hypothetical protein